MHAHEGRRRTPRETYSQKGRFNMSSVLLLVIGAGALAVLYGIVQTASLLQASPGNARMQEIAAAIQEGRAGLSEPPVHHHRHRRRGRPRSSWLLPDRPLAAVGFLIGAVLSGAGRLRGHADLGARQRAHRPGLVREPGQGPVAGLHLRRHHRHAGGGLRPDRRRRLLRLPDRPLGHASDQPRRGRRAWSRWASAPR